MALRYSMLFAFCAFLALAGCGSTGAVKDVGMERDPNAGGEGGQGGVAEPGDPNDDRPMQSQGGSGGKEMADAGTISSMDARPTDGSTLVGASQRRPPRPADEDFNAEATAKLRFGPATAEEISQVQNNLNTLFPAKTFKASSGLVLPYRLHTPARNSYKNAAPLVVFMHVAGERGSDNAAQVGPSVFIAGPGVLSIGERAKVMPAFILAPQCPPSENWDGVQGGPTALHFSGATKSLKATMELVDAVIKENPTIDTRRVYVMGMSMGGFATWEMISRWPEKFAAAAPMCGGGDPNFAAKIVHMPVWAFHSRDDGAVPIVWDEAIINKLKSLGGTPRFKVYNGPGHIVWTPAYREPDFLSWMFSQSQ